MSKQQPFVSSAIDNQVDTQIISLKPINGVTNKLLAAGLIRSFVVPKLNSVLIVCRFELISRMFSVIGGK